MTKVLTKKELDEMKKETKKESSLTYKIFASGGAGINIASILKKHKAINDENIVLLDTSVANISSANENLKFIKIKEVDGSGMLRSSNYEKINSLISSGEISNQFADVNIFIFSLNGGTGSVIAPLLIKEAKRKGKISVAFIITDDESKIHVRNAFNTLQSIENIAEQNNIYLPTIVFDNSINVREIIDNSIISNLNFLISIIETNFIERDSSDKINWLQPINVVPELLPGMKTLSITTSVDEVKDPLSGEVFINTDDITDLDSLFIICKSSVKLQPTKDCHIIFRGYDETSEFPIIGCISDFQPFNYFKKLNDRLNRFESIRKKGLEIKQDFITGTSSSNGMVL